MILPRLLVFACLAASLAGEQAISPDEMQLRSSAWWPKAQTALKVETKLVEVGVVVRDSRGHPVGGLTRDDFEIEDSGKKRGITAFSVETSGSPAAGAVAASAPAAQAIADVKPPDVKSIKVRQRFLGLFFDDFSMNGAETIQAKAAAKRFLKHGLAPGDHVAIFSTSHEQNLAFTSDTAKLNQAIDRLSFSQRSQGFDGCPAFTPYDAYQIATKVDSTALEVKIEEAMRCGACPSSSSSRRGRGSSSSSASGPCAEQIQAQANSVWTQVRDTSRRTLGAVEDVVDYMAQMPGSRVLLMASSGFLSGTLEHEQDEVADHALRGEVVVNSLDAKGLFTEDAIQPTLGAGVRSIIRLQSLGTRPKDEANDALAVLSASTGGLFFHNNNDLDLGFRELGLVPEVFYSLGFTPSETPDSRYHRLKVRLKSANHYTIQARPGYFAAVAQTEAAPVERPIDREVLTQTTLGGVPVEFRATSAKTEAGEFAMKVVLAIDVQRLPFQTMFGIRRQKLTLIAALFNESGGFVTGKQAEIQFALKDETFGRMAAGMDAGLTLIAPPGKYRLRGVVQEANGGKLTAMMAPVEIQ